MTHHTAHARNGQRTPAQIESEIERTRREMADTVAAVVERANVKRRAAEKVDHAKQSAGNAAKRSAKPTAIALGLVAAAAVAVIVLQRRNESRWDRVKRRTRSMTEDKAKDARKLTESKAKDASKWMSDRLPSAR